MIIGGLRVVRAVIIASTPPTRQRAPDRAGALLLYSAKVAALNLSGIVVFLARGVNPRRYWEQQRVQRFAWAGMAFRVLAPAVLIIAIVLFNDG